MHSYVVNVNWKTLQPKPGAFRPASLDRAINAARQQDSRIKLRVMAGIHAPDWAKRRGGSPVKLRDPDGSTGTVPRFWTGAFGKAYVGLQKSFAARYDNNATVAEVVISRCTTFYAEPFVRQTSVAASRKALKRAGYTKAQGPGLPQAADQGAPGLEADARRPGLQPGAVRDRQRWPHRRRRVHREDDALLPRPGLAAAACWRTTPSARRSTPSTRPRGVPHYQRMYKAMTKHSPQRAFQTATAARMGNCERTLDWAADRGASYVGFPWNASDAGCTAQILRDAARRLG